MSRYPRLVPVGEDALLVEYEPEISLAVNQRVRQLAYRIEQSARPGVTEIIPAYRSLMVYFNPDQIQLAELSAEITTHATARQTVDLPAPRRFVIPTVYGGSYGLDLERVAAATGLTTEEVIHQFATQVYPVYCLGFLCSLAYLGGVPEILRLPRLATPRTWLPAGSVGFAGAQAVVLPIDQPSGWHYIGRTFVTMYDPHRFPPTALRPGDLVQCPRVSETEAQKWAARFIGDCLIEGTADS